MDLEHDPLGADPELGIDRAAARRERPVDRPGVAVEREQLLVAAEAEEPAADDLEIVERARGAPPGSAAGSARANGSGPRRGRRPRSPGSNRHCSAPPFELERDHALGRRGEQLVGEVADPDRRRAQLGRPAAAGRSRGRAGGASSLRPGRPGWPRADGGMPVGRRATRTGRVLGACELPAAGPAGTARAARGRSAAIWASGGRASSAATRSAERRLVPARRSSLTCGDTAGRSWR